MVVFHFLISTKFCSLTMTDVVVRNHDLFFFDGWKIGDRSHFSVCLLSVQDAETVSCRYVLEGLLSSLQLRPWHESTTKSSHRHHRIGIRTAGTWNRIIDHTSSGNSQSSSHIKYPTTTTSQRCGWSGALHNLYHIFCMPNVPMSHRAKPTTLLRLLNSRRIKGDSKIKQSTSLYHSFSVLQNLPYIHQHRYSIYLQRRSSLFGKIIRIMSYSSTDQPVRQLSSVVDATTKQEGVVERTIREKLVASLSPITHLTILNESHRHNV
jgi:hypothetical protein